MKIAIAALGLATAIALVACPPASTVTTFRATLSGASEVPPLTGVTGTGTVTATLNGSTLTLTGTYSGLTGAPAQAHIHGPAAAGVNAGVLCNLYPVDSGAPAGTGTLSGSGAASNQCSSLTLTAQQISDLNANLWYVNVHTAANTGGEVRGQLIKQ